AGAGDCLACGRAQLQIAQTMTTAFIKPEPGLEPVPGYRLVERLGGGGFGEVWKATASGGLHVALQFVSVINAHAEIEMRALDLIREIRHPNLLVTFGAWPVDDWLIIGMELADRTLMDHNKKETTKRKP